MSTRNDAKMSVQMVRLPILVILACLGLDACLYLEKPLPESVPISHRLFWNGLAPDKYSATPAFAADSVVDSGLVKVHELEFAGTDSFRLRLKEFRHPYLAYAAFQNRATYPEMSEGYFRNGESLVFRHGEFFGELQLLHGGMVPAHILKEKLSFRGEPIFLAPPEFTSFPLLGRIPHSERVFMKHFLGRSWQGPVFSVSYRCHGDTATAFRADAQDIENVETWLQEWHGRVDTLGWGRGRELRFQGSDEFLRPLVFWIYTDAIVGMEGCSDFDLAIDHTRKLGKIRDIWSKH